MKHYENLKKEVREIKAKLALFGRELKAQKKSTREIRELQQNIERIEDLFSQNDQRLEEAEMQINLLTRVLTTICIEKLGMRLGELRRLIRQTEKEASSDSEIAYLNALFSLETKHPTYHKHRRAITDKSHKPPHKNKPPKSSDNE